MRDSEALRLAATACELHVSMDLLPPEIVETLRRVSGELRYVEEYRERMFGPQPPTFRNFAREQDWEPPASHDVGSAT